MTRLEWLAAILAILLLVRIFQEERAYQQQKQAHQQLISLLVDFATMVGEIFPFLKTLIGKP
jgi:hypothetical protein